MRATVASVLLLGALVFSAPAQAQQKPRKKPTPTTTTPAKPKPTVTKPTTPAAKPAEKPVAKAVAKVPPKPLPPPDESSFSITGGVSKADLDFGVGPGGGGLFRFRKGTWPIALRLEAAFNHFSQTTKLGGVALNQKATLNHIGAAAGLEIPLGDRKAAIRPYLLGTIGVYRFQGSGPAGDLSTITNGVFTATTDLGGGIGAGLHLGSHFLIEGRYLNTGNFSTIPISLGITF